MIAIALHYVAPQALHQLGEFSSLNDAAKFLALQGPTGKWFRRWSAGGGVIAGGVARKYGDHKIDVAVMLFG